MSKRTKDQCSDCGGDFPGRLDAHNRCVWCAPVAMTCDRGHPCEWDRLHSHTGHGCGSLGKLRLCDEHRERFDEGKP